MHTTQCTNACTRVRAHTYTHLTQKQPWTRAHAHTHTYKHTHLNAQKQEVVAEPLIVGVLLFVPLLALLPTTLAWHTLVTCAHAAAVLVRMALLLAAALLRCNPLLLLGWRLARPMAFPGARPAGQLQTIGLDLFVLKRECRGRKRSAGAAHTVPG